MCKFIDIYEMSFGQAFKTFKINKLLLFLVE